MSDDSRLLAKNRTEYPFIKHYYGNKDDANNAFIRQLYHLIETSEENYLRIVLPNHQNSDGSIKRIRNYLKKLGWDTFIDVFFDGYIERPVHLLYLWCNRETIEDPNIGDGETNNTRPMTDKELYLREEGLWIHPKDRKSGW